MENNISKGAMQDVADFLEVLGRNIKMNGDDVEAIRLKGASKRVSGSIYSTRLDIPTH